MELANSVFPKRAIVKCKAKMQLLTNPMPDEIELPLDSELINELAMTLFHTARYSELRQSCRSRDMAKLLESQLATELVTSYRKIKQQQKDPAIQSLNALL